jgi:hypothetical protein
MFKQWMVSLCAVLVLGLFLTGCDEDAYDPGGPVPEALLTPAVVDFTAADVDAVVDVVYTEIPSLAPRGNGTPPAACDFVRFQRYMPKADYSGNAPDADACLLMVPGVLEGANGFDYIGRNLVYIAKQQYGMNVEVWAMDRRNNCLEDIAGTQAAEKAATAKEAQAVAMDYYYNKKSVGGKTFAGFPKSKDLPFLSEFGLKMDTEDMFTIITTMVPDPEIRKNKVFVGGHSLGGVHTSMFAGWDLDGNPATLGDAGFNNTAGLFAFDSTVSPVSSLVDSALAQYLGFVPQSYVNYGKSLTKVAYDTAVYGLRKNIIPRYVDGSVARLAVGSPIDAETMAVIEVLGILAYEDPDAENTAIREIPMSANMKETLNKYIARNKVQLDAGVPSATDFRFTNEALLGMFFDDDFTHLEMIRVSMGFLNGGPVIEKDPELGYDDLFVPADAGPDLGNLGKGPLYSWANYDEVANNDDTLYQDGGKTVTFTTMDDEVADIRAFSRALFAGDTNLVEWYFSLRRLVDIMAAIMDYGPKYGLNFIHADKVSALPKIEFPAADSMMSGTMNGSDEFDVLTGFNHMDPMFAAANTPDHRENQVIYPLLDFVAANRK